MNFVREAGAGRSEVGRNPLTGVGSAPVSVLEE